MISLFKEPRRIDQALKDNVAVVEKTLESLQINGVRFVRELKKELDKPSK